MADNTNNIVISVSNGVDSQIAPRLIQIADASERAEKSVGSLKTQLASLNGSSLNGLQSLLQGVQSGSVAASTAQSNLSNAMRQTASGTMAANGALRTLEGSMFGATRAASSFLTTALGLGPVLQAAFPIIGAMALIDILYQVGNGFFKTITAAENAGRNIAKAFDESIGALRKSDDELSITNDRLDQTIAKLQGRPTSNGVQLALDEARQAADRLDDSLEKVQRDLDQTLHKYSVSWIGGVLTGQSSTGGTADFIQKQFDQLNDIRQKATESIDQASSLGDPKASRAALKQAYSDERKAIQGVVTALQNEYNEKQRIQNTPAITVQTPYGPTESPKFDQTANLTMLGKAAHLAQEEMRNLDLTYQNIGKETTVSKLRDSTSELKSETKQASEEWKKLESDFVKFQSDIDKTGHKPTAQQNLGWLQSQEPTINPLNRDKLAAKELPYENQVASESFYSEQEDRLKDQVAQIGLYDNALKESSELDRIKEQARRRNITLTAEQTDTLKQLIATTVESQAYDRELAAIYNDITEPTTKFAAEIRALNELQSKGLIDSATYAQGIKAEQKAYNEATDAVTKFKNEIADAQRNETNKLGTQRQIGVNTTLQGLDEQLRKPGADSSHPFGYSDQEIAAVNAELRPLISAMQQKNAIDQETNKILNQQDDLMDQLSIKEAARTNALNAGAISQNVANAGRLKDRATLNDSQLASGVGGNPFSGSIMDYAKQFQGVAKGIEDTFTPVFKTLSDGFADSLGRAIVYGKNLGSALRDVARSAISELLSGLTKLGIQEVINLTMGTAAGTAATAAGVAQATTLATAWAPAAFAASVASFGAADAIGGAAYTSGLAAATALSGVPKLASGTNSVPSDMFAFIHQNER